MNDEVDVNALITLYNQKVSQLSNQVILLEAKLQTVTQDYKELKEKHQSTFEERIILIPKPTKYSQISKHSRAAGGSPKPPHRSISLIFEQSSGVKFRLMRSSSSSIFRTLVMSGRHRSICLVRPHIGQAALHLSVNSR